MKQKPHNEGWLFGPSNSCRRWPACVAADVGSENILLALTTSQGPFIFKVGVGRPVGQKHGQEMFQRRKIWGLDATNILHRFALYCIDLAVDQLGTLGIESQSISSLTQVQRAYLQGDAVADDVIFVRSNVEKLIVTTDQAGDLETILRSRAATIATQITLKMGEEGIPGYHFPVWEAAKWSAEAYVQMTNWLASRHIAWPELRESLHYAAQTHTREVLSDKLEHIIFAQRSLAQA